MKRLLMAASALLTLSAAPAFAQSVSGTVHVTGTVATKCVVLPDGATTFTDTIALGELADVAGRLRSELAGSTAGAPAGSVNFQVNCNGTDATVSLSAARLANAAASAPGYSNSINYTAELDADLASGSEAQFTYNTTTLPAPTTGTLTERLANAPGNIVVKVYNLASTNGATTLLVAGSYAGDVTVSITPNS